MDLYVNMLGLFYVDFHCPSVDFLWYFLTLLCIILKSETFKKSFLNTCWMMNAFYVLFSFLSLFRNLHWFGLYISRGYVMYSRQNVATITSKITFFSLFCYYLHFTHLLLKKRRNSLPFWLISADVKTARFCTRVRMYYNGSNWEKRFSVIFPCRGRMSVLFHFSVLLNVADQTTIWLHL